ncbi:MAG: Rho termination factor N-terminal domain-containing protein [Atopobiaceae bacterium]|jgi:hypothetical protein|nr:Rho termination factor N-terminal domain-containing protein [Atopobiaceae bacterium]
MSKATEDDLARMTVRELRELAREMGVSLGYASATKADMVSCISGYLGREDA